jgi:hypothetical protein
MLASRRCANQRNGWSTRGSDVHRIDCGGKSEHDRQVVLTKVRTYRESRRKQRLLPGELLREDVELMARELAADEAIVAGLGSRAPNDPERAWFEQRRRQLKELREEFEAVRERLRLSSSVAVFGTPANGSRETSAHAATPEPVWSDPSHHAESR